MALLNWIIAHPEEALIIWVAFVVGVVSIVTAIRSGEN
jgi:hypothetical protein